MTLHIEISQQLGALTLNVNLNIPPKGVTAVFGRSGAGKSSLINVVAGLTTPQQGKISLNGRVLFDSMAKINLPPEQRHIGYVFQEHRLFPHYTVKKNLTYGCKRFNLNKFLQMVELLGITHLLDRFPNSLSGGEKQRVAIGRALLSEPDILLMDEPLSALDLPRKNELLGYLSELAQQVEIPILYVSHSLDEVVRLADYLLLLDNGQTTAFGRTGDVWQSEAFRAWQPEGQKTTLLELPIIEEKNEYQLQGLALGAQRIWLNCQPRYRLGDKLRLTIAGRDVSITLDKPNRSSIRNILHGTICNIQSQNDHLNIAVNVEGEIIWATISRWAADELGLKTGESVYLQIKSVSI